MLVVAVVVAEQATLVAAVAALAVAAVLEFVFLLSLV